MKIFIILLKNKAFLIFLFFLSSCVVGPDYQRPQIDTPAAFSKDATTPSPEIKDWIEIYNDNHLTALVTQARDNNFSLKGLYQRVLQARAIIDQNKAESRPQLNGNIEYTRQKNAEGNFIGGEAFDNYNAALGLGWELDLFGRVSRLIESAQADAGAAKAAYLDLLLFTETEVAISYFRLQALDQEINAVQRSVHTRRQSLEIIKNRFESGIVSDLDVARAETILAESEANMAALQRAYDIRKHALAVLTGQTAPSFELKLAPSHSTPPRIPISLPSDLLQQRPDIRQSEFLLQQANARIGLATANFYPRISLGGGVGFTSFDTNSWFKSNANFYNIGPNISLPIFQGGRLRAELSRSESAYAEALANYKQTIVEAFAEVENALSGLHYLGLQRAARERATRAAQRAQVIANEQYLNGIIDFITALDAERTALDTERLLAQTIGNEYENSVLLIRSIGGSWK